jgi:hypothetical protein
MMVVVDGGWDEKRMIGKRFGDQEIFRQRVPAGCTEKEGGRVTSPETGPVGQCHV